VIGDVARSYGSLKNCDLCEYRYPESELVPCSHVDDVKMVCSECLRNGTYLWYRSRMKEERLVSKKIILNGSLKCPTCDRYAYDIDKGFCTTTACVQVEKGIKPEERVLQLLELAEFVCPFCHKLWRDLNNKICLIAHISDLIRAKAHPNS